MNKDEFINELKKINVILSEEQLKQLDIYYKMLLDWNEKINLTSIIDEKEVYLKHFYDSISLIKSIDLNKIDSLCDMGTGAGFPGLVLKIVYPNLNVSLVDSLNKRLVFLNEVIKTLNLKKIQTIHSRIEDFSKKNIEVFDCVTTRAVANLSIILEISIKSVKVNGYFIAMKANCDDEIEQVKKNIDNLNCSIDDIIKFKLPIENSNRTLVKIKKINKTTNKYPRKIDIIKKSL